MREVEPNKCSSLRLGHLIDRISNLQQSLSIVFRTDKLRLYVFLEFPSRSLINA